MKVIDRLMMIYLKITLSEEARLAIGTNVSSLFARFSQCGTCTPRRYRRDMLF